MPYLDYNEPMRDHFYALILYGTLLLTPTIVSNPALHVKEAFLEKGQVCLTTDFEWPVDWLGPLEQAMNYWNEDSDVAHPNKQKFIYKGYVSRPFSNCTHIRTVQTLPNSDWLAAATKTDVWVLSTIKWSIETVPTSYTYHLPSILVHELGHVLGFPHQEKTIMRTTFERGQVYYYNVADPNLNQFKGYTEWLREVTKKLEESK